MNPTGSTTDRLTMYAEILCLIDARRQATGAAELGASIEKFIVDAQFAELEAEILENPGAFDPWLVRPRQDRRQ
jgi:hypothetical protein